LVVSYERSLTMDRAFLHIARFVIDLRIVAQQDLGEIKICAHEQPIQFTGKAMLPLVAYLDVSRTFTWTGNVRQRSVHQADMSIHALNALFCHWQVTKKVNIHSAKQFR